MIATHLALLVAPGTMIREAGEAGEQGEGSVNPFVEVEFDDQRHRTQTKVKDLNPVWNEKFVFNVSDPKDLPKKTIDIVVYDEWRGHRNFLGRVKIFGVSIPNSEPEAGIQRYPLDKRGLFSNIRDDIALKIFAGYDYYLVPP
ncbi:hypothetical protein NE237_016675 [Protea cynaroides]|uniref:C2 domain-containing protein n=1 Tax=Protea cynaroides TaxID=273540 RepID=A0A9Q0HGG7_9MAGN|nr:hypothetical protein NE237_016675 [Protea cynaroides]